MPTTTTRLALSKPAAADAVSAFQGTIGTSLDTIDSNLVRYTGAWSGATAYTIKDLVTLRGFVYSCILGHTNQTPPNVTYWDQLTPNVVYTVQVVAPASAVAVAEQVANIRIPSTLHLCKLRSVAATVATVSTSGLPTVQVRNVTTGNVDMLSTAITIDANETDTSTAATPAVIDTASSHDVVHTADIIAFDVDVAGTGTKGLIVELQFS